MFVFDLYNKINYRENKIATGDFEKFLVNFEKIDIV